MKSVFAPTLAALIAASVAPSSLAAPLFGGDDLQRNGAVSKHLWRPDFAVTQASGVRFSAGMALGLKGAARNQLGRSATPALTLELSNRSSISILPAGSRGTMVVLQTPL